MHSQPSQSGDGFSQQDDNRRWNQTAFPKAGRRGHNGPAPPQNGQKGGQREGNFNRPPPGYNSRGGGNSHSGPPSGPTSGPPRGPHSGPHTGPHTGPPQQNHQQFGNHGNHRDWNHPDQQAGQMPDLVKEYLMKTLMMDGNHRY